MNTDSDSELLLNLFAEELTKRKRLTGNFANDIFAAMEGKKTNTQRIGTKKRNDDKQRLGKRTITYNVITIMRVNIINANL